MTTKDLFRRMTLAASLAVVAFAAPFMAGPSAWAAETKASATNAAPTTPATPTQDHVVLTKNGGTLVKGQILEENATSVTMMVEFPGMPAVKTTYLKSEVVSIKHDQPVDGAAAPGTPSIKKDDSKGDRVKEQLAPTATADDDAAKIMVIKLEGTIGRDISKTPMTEMFEKVDEQFADLDSSGNVKPERKDKNILVFEVDASTDARRGFDGFFAAESLAPLLEKQFGKGRRIVFWIKKAEGGAGYLPLISPEIYWKSDGELKGAGNDLDKFDMGDVMVNEKQISLRLGHAEGFPAKGGYGAGEGTPGGAVVRALARSQNWMVVRMEGGKPIIIERAPTEADFAASPNWTILKDDGKDKNKDAKKTEGNDKLNLKAEWARNLGLSKGTADTVEDLAFQFGVQRNWKEIEKPIAQKVLKDWHEAVEAAIDRIRPQPSQSGPRGTLWRDFDDIAGEPATTFEQQQKADGRRISILKQIQGIMTRFKEVFDPEGQQVSQLDLQIMQIKERMERAKRDRSRRTP
jgi:hypothetical protein